MVEDGLEGVFLAELVLAIEEERCAGTLCQNVARAQSSQGFSAAVLCESYLCDSACKIRRSDRCPAWISRVGLVLLASAKNLVGQGFILLPLTVCVTFSFASSRDCYSDPYRPV